MEYFEYPPGKRLQKYINCFWIIKSDIRDHSSYKSKWDRTLPDGSLEIVFHLEDDMIRKSLAGKTEREDKSILIGQVTEPYLFAATGKIYMLGIRFFPHTAHHFFEVPLEDVNDRSLDLELLWNRQCRILKDRLKAAKDDLQRIRMLESFLFKKIKDRKTTTRDNYFTHASNTILYEKGTASIGDISSEIGISNRYLEQIFRSKMGISPKFFSGIIRFQHTLKHMNPKLPGSLTEAAHENGYFDQSHFIRDFKKFTGLTPKKFIKEQHPITCHFIDPQNSSYLYNF